MYKMKKRAISTIIASLLLVALTIVGIAIVGVIIKNVINEQKETTESCFGIFEDVTLNGIYTCYNNSSEDLLFSIKVGDVDIQKIVVTISGEGITKSLGINTTASTITGVANYPSGLTSITLPNKNSGKTYIYDLSVAGFTARPYMIEIAPVVEGTQCDVSDSMTSINNC